METQKSKIPYVINTFGATYNAPVELPDNEEIPESPNQSREEQKAEEPEQPINYTDPWVYHDPSVESSTVVRLYQPTTTNKDAEERGVGTNEPYDSLNVDGIFFPIIKFNNTVIDHYMIEYMKISYDYSDFYPSLLLYIQDPNNSIAFSDTPGPNNVLTIIIVPPKDGLYKKISLDFYIDSCYFDKLANRITVYASYKFLPFEQTVSGSQIKYGGCPNKLGKVTSNNSEGDGTVECNGEPQIKPNFWEMAHEICLSTGLGLATTDNIKDINDRLPRVINQPMTYSKYIQSQIKMAGVDENSVFDCWIDLYRYLVIVNVAWVLNEDVKYKNLVTQASLGFAPSDQSGPEVRVKRTFRTLTNFDQLGEPSDLQFDPDSFEEIIDNTQKFTGYTQNTNVLGVRGGSSDAVNGINEKDITRNPSSVDDDHKEDYETVVMTHCTNRIDVEYNTNLQKNIRENFFRKYRSKRYKLKLIRPNFGLNRGTLVNVVSFTTDTKEKLALLESSTNVDGNNTIEKDNISAELKASTGMSLRDIAINSGIPVTETQKNGIYYIDGMTFEYSYGDNEIVQTLYLIKKGSQTNLNNKYTSPRLGPNEFGEPSSESSPGSQQTTSSSASSSNNQMSNIKNEFPASFANVSSALDTSNIHINMNGEDAVESSPFAPQKTKPVKIPRFVI